MWVAKFQYIMGNMAMCYVSMCKCQCAMSNLAMFQYTTGNMVKCQCAMCDVAKFQYATRNMVMCYV